MGLTALAPSLAPLHAAPRDKAAKSDKAVKPAPADPQSKAAPANAVTPPEAAEPPPQKPDPVPEPAAAAPQPPRESVDADVSVRSVAVTSAFTGTEVVLFGAINNARPQTSRTDGYDIVIVFEGSPTSVLLRRKSNIGGIWLNSSSLQLDRLPSYYAIASTRPLSEIAQPETLKVNHVGFDYVSADEAPKSVKQMDKAQVAAFKSAAVDLKRRDGLYNDSEYGVSFIGRSLFRAAIQLPANVPVGQLTARVMLFRGGDMIAQTPAKVLLTRQGIERSLYSFAFDHPLLYGLSAVALAVCSGVLASALFNRRAG